MLAEKSEVTPSADAHPTVPAKTVSSDGLRRALFSLGGVLVALMVFEIGFRLFAPRMRAHAPRSDRPKQFYLPANSPDGRNSNFSLAKPPGVFRIVVVGDSFTYGGESQYDDNFARRLERMFATRTDLPRVEVINWGMPGYSTAQEIVLVNRAVEKISADLVILQITLNDPELQPYRVSHQADKQKLSLLDVWPLSEWRSMQYVRQRIGNTILHRNYIHYFFDLFENPQTWNRFADALAAIKHIGDAKKVPVIAVVFPLFSHRIDESYPFAPLHQKIATQLEQLGMPQIDLMRAYEGIPPERLQSEPGVDNHPNEIAHRIAADAIYANLRRMKALPEELLFKTRRVRHEINLVNPGR